MAIEKYRFHRSGYRRLSMQMALEILGVDWPEIRHGHLYCNNSRGLTANSIAGVRRHRPFWVRNEDKLDELAHAVKSAYHRTIRQIGHDFDENKEASQGVIEAYAFIKKQLKKRGVYL